MAMSISNRFMVSGVTFVVVGMLFGIWMGTSGPETFNYAPVHAHINLVGWASMFLCGLWYAHHPNVARTTLAEVHFWCALVGAVLLVLGILGAVIPNPTIDLAVIPGSLLALLGMLIFGWIVWRAALQPAAM